MHYTLKDKNNVKKQSIPLPKSLPPKTLHNHIKKICKDNSIEIIYVSRSSSARASREGRTIFIKKVNSPKCYVVALHEIGHLLGRQFKVGTLKDEFHAWKWARYNAIMWNPTMSTKAINSFTSYAVSMMMDMIW